MTGAPQTTHRAELERGPVVIDGKLQWASATILTAGDERTLAGCMRRWWYVYVAGFAEGSTGSQTLGTATHEEIEGYMRTGVNRLGAIAMQAKHCIPEPGPDLMIEHALEPLITVAGVPVHGHIDLMHRRCVNVGASDFGDAQDPPGTVEVRDWKTTSDYRYAKTPDELRSNTQMVTYGRYALAKFDPTFVRLTHVYIRTRGGKVPALNRSVRMRPDEILAEWEQVEAVGRRIAQAAGATRAEDVPANTKACSAYRGCPHRSYCKAGSHDSLATMFGAELAAELIALEGQSLSSLEEPQGEKPTMSLLGILNPAVTGAPATPAPDALPGVTPLPAAEGVGVAVDLKAQLQAQIAQLEAQERAAAAAAQAKAAVPIAVLEGFPEALDVIARSVHEAQPVGMPPLGGEAAKMYAAVKGIALEGHGYAGSGQLGGTPVVTDPAKLIELSQRLVAGGKVQPTPTAAPTPAVAAGQALGILPPDAPASKPELAAKPVEGFSAAPDVAATSRTAGVNGGPVDGSGAPPADTGDKPKRGRPKKVDRPVGEAAAKREGSGIEIFVDAIPNVEFTSLDGYVRDLLAVLCKEHGTIDVRIAPPDSPLAYGKWKGAVAALATRKPPAPDTYAVVRPDEVFEVVLEALRLAGACDLFVRGVR